MNTFSNNDNTASVGEPSNPMVHNEEQVPQSPVHHSGIRCLPRGLRIPFAEKFTPEENEEQVPQSPVQQFGTRYVPRGLQWEVPFIEKFTPEEIDYVRRFPQEFADVPLEYPGGPPIQEDAGVIQKRIESYVDWMVLGRPRFPPMEHFAVPDHLFQSTNESSSEKFEGPMSYEDTLTAMKKLPSLNFEGNKVQAQGKSKDSRKRMGKLARQNAFKEFGYRFDPSNEKHLNKYLKHVDEWLRKVKLPKNVENLLDFVKSWAKNPQRISALQVLRQAGNPYAKLFLSSLSGELTQERYDSWNFAEAQYVTEFINLLWFFTTMFILYQGYKHKDILESVRKASVTVNKVTDIGSVVKDVATAVRDAGRSVLEFLNNIVDQVLNKLEELDVISRSFLTGFLKTVLAIVAFEYARTLFPSMYEDVKAYVCQALGFINRTFKYDAVQAQGDGDGILEEVLQFVSQNFIKKPWSKTSLYLEQIPKLVSVAKSIEWIFSNLRLLVSWAVEVWTGEPQPKVKQEIDICAFYVNVGTLAADLDLGTAEDIFSDEVKISLSCLVSERDRLTKQVVFARSMRPVFIQRFNQAVSELMKLERRHEMEMQRAQKRAVPVWLYVHGAPGEGKSHDMEILCNHVWRYLREFAPNILPDGDFHTGHTYELNQKEDFFDGYREQFYVTIDDLFQSKVPEDRFMMAQRLIQFVSPSPYSLRVAEIEHKAKTFFTSKCIISTSNLAPKFSGESMGLCDPSALETRITISVKKVKDRYIFDNQDVIIGGIQVTDVDVFELGALVAEAIIARDKARLVPIATREIQRMQDISFKSARLQFDTVEKGKEKIEAQGRENDCPEWCEPEEWNEFCVKYESLSERQFSILARATFERKESNPQELVPEEGESLDGFVKRLKNINRLYKKRNDKVTNPKYAYWAKWRNYTFRDMSWRDRLFRPKKVVKKLWRNLGWFFSKDGDSAVFKYLGSGFVFGMVNSRHELLPCPVQRPSSWGEYWAWMDLDQYKWSPNLDREWWQQFSNELIPVYGDPQIAHTTCRLSITGPISDGQWSLMRSQPGFINGLMMGVATMAIWGYVGYKVVSLMMPATAYAQASYEQQVKTKKVVRQIRAKKKGPRQMTRVPSAQGDNKDIFRKIVRNSEIIETRLSAPGEKWDVVQNHPIVGTSYCQFVYENYALVPGHVMFGAGTDKDLRWFSLIRGQQYHCTSDEIDFCEEVASDLYLVRFPELAHRSNICSLFKSDFPMSGRVGHLEPDPLTTGYVVQHALSWENKEKEIPVNGDYGSFGTDLCLYGITNKKGLCGTPYIHEATGKILGIHMGGIPTSERAFAVIVLQGDIAQWDPRTTIKDPLPLDEDLEAQAIEGIQVIGMLPEKMKSFVPRTSNLHKSKFDYKTFPVPETDSAPAPLDRVERVIDGEVVSVSPVQVAVAKFSTHKRVPSPKRPKTVNDCLPSNFSPRAVEPCTIWEAIFGKPGYMKSLDMSASSGYYWKRLGFTRRDLCYKDGKPHIHPLLLADVESRLERMRGGEVIPVVYEETLKDEIRSKKKVDEVSSRLFSSGDFSSLIIQRMYLGFFFVEFTKDPVSSPIGLALNPHSAQWGGLYSRLRGSEEEKRKIGGGDFSMYDISVKNLVKEEFITFVCQFFEDKKMIVTVIESNFAGWHVLGRLVFLRPWGTSSGSFITSMFNSFGNWYVHKTAFIAIYSEDEWSEVETTFTGDDSLFSVPEKWADYNMAYLEKFFNENYAMTYTSPTKTKDMTLTWEDAVYLKRKFVMGHMGIMAPLEKASLANMVKWIDGDETEEVQQGILSSVLLEAWHHGQEFFDQCHDWCAQEQKRLDQRFVLFNWRGLNDDRSQDY